MTILLVINNNLIIVNIYNYNMYEKYIEKKSSELDKALSLKYQETQKQLDRKQVLDLIREQLINEEIIENNPFLFKDIILTLLAITSKGFNGFDDLLEKGLYFIPSPSNTPQCTINIIKDIALDYISKSVDFQLTDGKWIELFNFMKSQQKSFTKEYDIALTEPISLSPTSSYISTSNYETLLNTILDICRGSEEHTPKIFDLIAKKFKSPKTATPLKCTNFDSIPR